MELETFCPVLNQRVLLDSPVESNVLCSHKISSSQSDLNRPLSGGGSGIIKKHSSCEILAGELVVF